MKRILPVAIFAALIVIVAIMSSCGADGGYSTSDLSPTHSMGEIQATVYVGGVVSEASEEEIVVLDFVDRQPVKIRLLDANGPGQQFFRQATNPNVGLTLSQAAPQSGEDVCVLARLLPDGELV